MLHPSVQQEVIDLAVTQIMDILTFLMEELLAEGYVITDHVIEDDAEFIAYYVDLWQTNVVPFLQTVNPKLAREYETRYARIMGKQIEAGVA